MQGALVRGMRKARCVRSSGFEGGSRRSRSVWIRRVRGAVAACWACDKELEGGVTRVQPKQGPLATSQPQMKGRPNADSALGPATRRDCGVAG